MPRKRVTIACQTCGHAFEVQPSRLKHGRGRSCSPSCQHAATAAKLSRQVEITCIGCGATFSRAPRHIGPNGKGKYCSRPCRDANRIGSAHPQFISGDGGYRGPNWQAQKRKARKRDDDTCQRCFAPGRDVHHIRPYRLFDGDYIAANALANLRTLCHRCHRKVEAELQRQAA